MVVYNLSAKFIRNLGFFYEIFSLVHSTWNIFLCGNNWDPMPECGIPLGYRQVRRPSFDFSVSTSEQICYVVALCNVKFGPAQHSEKYSDV